MVPQGFTVSEEKVSSVLCLIVDKQNIFGSEICKKTRGTKTVLVTSATLYETPNYVLPVSYQKRIPEIPEGNYTHIFFIWDGKEETLPIVEPLLGKASQEKARFVFLTDYHFYSVKLGDYLQEKYAQTIILLTGDIFGKAGYETQITKLFADANQTGVVKLTSVGLHTMYPITYNDTIEQVIASGFGQTRGGGVRFVFTEYGMTELSIVHTLQQSDPMIKVDFVKGEEADIDLPKGEYLFPTHYAIGRKLQDFFAVYAEQNKKEKYHMPATPQYSPFAIEKEKQSKKVHKKHWLFVLLFLFLVLFSPLIFTASYMGVGAGMLFAAVQTAKQGNIPAAAQFATTGTSFFSLAKQSTLYSESELTLFFLPNAAKQLGQIVGSGELGAHLISDGLSAIMHFQKMESGPQLEASTNFFAGLNNLKDAVTLLQEMPNSLSYQGISLVQVQHVISPFASLIDVAPQLLGFPTPKTYLVLFQNNMELRPGGGFIGSYAIVTVDQGRVTHVGIHNVYDADGQLQGHVEPPPVLRRFLQVHWYLRDSNFDVDFSQDAANAAFFLKQETGQSADGVIGVDLTFVKYLLSLTGPVYLPEYNQTVTADNFFLLTEIHAEKNSFAGSTQKQDFLRAVFVALQEKFSKKTSFTFSAAVPLLQSILDKHMVFGFADPNIQDVFSVNGFSSSLWDGRKPSENTVLDFTGINEANLGVNKANYFLKRQESQAMMINPSGSVSGQLTVTYTNSSKFNQWPGGVYKDFLRVILPQGAILQGISMNGQQQSLVPAITDPKIYEAKGFVAPSGLEVYSATEEGKQTYGFFVNVKEQQTEKVTISYVLSQQLDLTKPTFSYSGLLFKQPGTNSYPYSFSLSFPTSYSLLEIPQGMHVSGNIISFTQDFHTDIPFLLQFTKN